MIAVLARDRYQFKSYLEFNTAQCDAGDYKFIRDYRDFAGLYFDDYILLDGFFERPDAGEIYPKILLNIR